MKKKDKGGSFDTLLDDSTAVNEFNCSSMLRLLLLSPSCTSEESLGGYLNSLRSCNELSIRSCEDSYLQLSSSQKFEYRIMLIPCCDIFMERLFEPKTAETAIATPPPILWLALSISHEIQVILSVMPSLAPKGCIC